MVLNDLTNEDHIPLYITWFPYLTKGDEQNTNIPRSYKKTKVFIEDNLKNSFFIPTYEPLIKYYQKHPSTRDTQFLFFYNKHATYFGSIKLSKLIGDILKRKLN